MPNQSIKSRYMTPARVKALEKARAVHAAKRGPTKYQWLIEAIKNHNSDECLLWPFAKTLGYGELRAGGTRVIAPRLAFKIAYGRWPFPVGRHTCDNPPCVNPRHIIEGTHADNVADRVRRGRQPRGEKCSYAKLTEQEVRQLRVDARRHNYTVLSKRYGICASQVCLIVNRKSWAHVI